MSVRSVSVIGLGKLGLPIAASMAARGLQVTGVDLNVHTVKTVQEGRAPFAEPGLDQMLEAAKDRLTATTDVDAAVRATQMSFIVVPTPSKPDGGFSLDAVLAVCEAIGAALSDVEDHVVVLTSTVLPGATGSEVRDVLERSSGKRAGDGFGLCYSPEFVALGSVITDFLRPDMILIGEWDRRSGDALESVYDLVCENDPPVSHMSLANAEVTKLAVNTFVTTKISYANMLAELCERIPDGDIDAVTHALGLDSRIGSRYLKGGLGYGGPCFPRDNIALAAFARSVGVVPAIPEATDAANRLHAEHVIGAVRALVRPGGTVGVLGLAYKTDTNVTECSAGAEIAAAVAREGIAVVAHDPAIAPGHGRLADGVTLVGSVAACVDAADVLVIATAWDRFRSEVPAALQRDPRERTVVDCWRILDPAALGDDVQLVRLGVG